MPGSRDKSAFGLGVVVDRHRGLRIRWRERPLSSLHAMNDWNVDVTTRPNVLFILGESHAPDLLSVAGHPVIQTPNLDRLAQRGSVFKHAYCASPLCVPARAAIATGLFPHENGYWDSSMAYDGRHPSWMHQLRHVGYHTAGIGKMHFRSDDDDVGFSEIIETMQIADGIGDLVSALRHEGTEPSYQGLWDIWTSRYGAGDDSPYRQYDERIAAAAENWLETAPKDAPWALSVHFISAHAPFVTPQVFFDMYKPEDVQPPVQFGRQERTDHPSIVHLRRIVPHDADISLDQVQALRAAYYATVSYLDALIGRVLAALNASGQAENTLIVYTSDHGFSLGDHFIFGLFHMFEESLKVPLILAGPGVPVGGQLEAAVSHVDLYPTLLEAAGLEESGTQSTRMAKSLWPILSGSAPDRGPVFSEYHGTATQTGGYVLRDGPMKLIHFVDMPPQLFDLVSDPEEGNNLANDSEHADVLDRMMTLLHARIDPGAVNTAAKSAQSALIAAHGGKAAVLQKMGGFSYTPPPGVRWQDMDGNQS